MQMKGEKFFFFNFNSPFLCMCRVFYYILYFSVLFKNNHFFFIFQFQQTYFDNLCVLDAFWGVFGLCKPAYCAHIGAVSTGKVYGCGFDCWRYGQGTGDV